MKKYVCVALFLNVIFCQLFYPLDMTEYRQLIQSNVEELRKRYQSELGKEANFNSTLHGFLREEPQKVYFLSDQPQKSEKGFNEYCSELGGKIGSDKKCIGSINGTPIKNWFGTITGYEWTVEDYRKKIEEFNNKCLQLGGVLVKSKTECQLESSANRFETQTVTIDFSYDLLFSILRPELAKGRFSLMENWCEKYQIEDKKCQYFDFIANNYPGKSAYVSMEDLLKEANLDIELGRKALKSCGVDWKVKDLQTLVLNEGVELKNLAIFCKKWKEKIAPNDVKQLIQDQINLNEAGDLREKWGRPIKIITLNYFKMRRIDLKEIPQLVKKWGDAVDLDEMVGVLTSGRITLDELISLKQNWGSDLSLQNMRDLIKSSVNLNSVIDQKKRWENEFKITTPVQLIVNKANLDDFVKIKNMFKEELSGDVILNLVNNRINLSKIIKLRDLFGNKLKLKTILYWIDRGTNIADIAKLKEVMGDDLSVDDISVLIEKGYNINDITEFKYVMENKFKNIEDIIKLNQYGVDAKEATDFIKVWGLRSLLSAEDLMELVKDGYDLKKTAEFKKVWGNSIDRIPSLKKLLKEKIDFDEAIQLREVWGSFIKVDDLIKLKKEGVPLKDAIKYRSLYSGELVIDDLINVKRKNRDAFDKKIAELESLRLVEFEKNRVKIKNLLSKLGGEKEEDAIRLYNFIVNKRKSYLNLDAIIRYIDTINSDVRVAIKKQKTNNITDKLLIMLKTMNSNGVTFYDTVFPKFPNLDQKGSVDYIEDIKLIEHKDYDDFKLIYPDTAIGKSIQSLEKLLKIENDEVFRREFKEQLNRTIYEKAFDCSKKSILADNLSMKTRFETSQSICLERVLKVMDRLNGEENGVPFSCFVVSGSKKDMNMAFKNNLYTKSMMDRSLVPFSGHYCKVFNSFQDLNYFTTNVLRDNPKRKIVIFGLGHGSSQGNFACSKKYYESSTKVLSSLRALSDGGHHVGAFILSCHSANIMKEKLRQDREEYNKKKGLAVEKQRKYLDNLKRFCLITSGGINDKGESTVSTVSTAGNIFSESVQGKNFWNLFQMMNKTKSDQFDHPLISGVPWSGFEDKSPVDIKILEDRICANQKCTLIKPIKEGPSCSNYLQKELKTVNQLMEDMKQLNLMSFQIGDDLDKARFEACQSFSIPTTSH